jgi:hypothetical protein
VSSLFSFLIDDQVGVESGGAQEAIMCKALPASWAATFRHQQEIRFDGANRPEKQQLFI